jgi:hypothetical protein
MAMTTVKVSKGVPPESEIEWRILAARYPRAKRGATSAANNEKAPDFSAKSGARAFLADRGGESAKQSIHLENQQDRSDFPLKICYPICYQSDRHDNSAKLSWVFSSCPKIFTSNQDIAKLDSITVFTNGINGLAVLRPAIFPLMYLDIFRIFINLKSNRINPIFAYFKLCVAMSFDFELLLGSYPFNQSQYVLGFNSRFGSHAALVWQLSVSR